MTSGPCLFLLCLFLCVFASLREILSSFVLRTSYLSRGVFMALDFTGGDGIFGRFGSFAGRAADAMALSGGAATARVLAGASLQTWAGTIEGYAAMPPVVSSVLDRIWQTVSGQQGNLRSFCTAYRASADAMLRAQVMLDTPSAQDTLTNA